MAIRTPHGPSSRERAERVLLRVFGVLRLAQYLPAGVVAASYDQAAYESPGIVFACLAVAVMWSVGLFTVAFRGWSVTPTAVVIDVLIMAVALVVVGRLITPEHALGWANWTLGPANAAGLFAMVWGRRWLAAAAVGLLALCYVEGVWPHLTGAATDLSAVSGNVASLVLFPTAAGLAAAWLRSSARTADEAQAAMIQANSQAAEAAARMETVEAVARERLRQYRALHDTVLSTLTVGAMGQIDLNTEDFRAQCARDAQYLRSLVTGTTDAVPTDLGVGLARIVRDVEALGLRIDRNSTDLPGGIPSHVTDALLGATREALNNARKHAGTGQVWLTARGDGAGVRITVVDRGAGFDPPAVRGGYGLLGSIRHRVVEAHGHCEITSAPGEGTTVEISWTP
nr:ATP-binding protein [Kibdelosporangium sp. MJ126-NF4]CEL18228.1 Two-component system, sensor protein [Kibdelosporangium sp. MJ126-NF4]CTQ90541.1 Two-component system, sensor protein [Kibdelosporangium sp. MJ126-NF4]